MGAIGLGELLVVGVVFLILVGGVVGLVVFLTTRKR
jgi:hypothetical protein